jgi:hypothetical protein
MVIVAVWVWVCILALLGLMTYALLVLAALARKVAELISKVAVLPTGFLPDGVQRGTSVEGLCGVMADGSSFSGAAMRGVNWLLLFAHPGCAPCEELVPAMLASSGSRDSVTTVIVAPHHAQNHKTDWIARLSRGVQREQNITLVLDDGSMSRQLNVNVAPYAFVINTEGEVRAHAAVSKVTDITALIERGRATVGARSLGRSEG